MNPHTPNVPLLFTSAKPSSGSSLTKEQLYEQISAMVDSIRLIFDGKPHLVSFTESLHRQYIVVSNGGGINLYRSIFAEINRYLSIFSRELYALRERDIPTAVGAMWTHFIECVELVQSITPHLDNDFCFTQACPPVHERAMDLWKTHLMSDAMLSSVSSSIIDEFERARRTGNINLHRNVAKLIRMVLTMEPYSRGVYHRYVEGPYITNVIHTYAYKRSAMITRVGEYYREQYGVSEEEDFEYEEEPRPPPPVPAPAQEPTSAGVTMTDSDLPPPPPISSGDIKADTTTSTTDIDTKVEPEVEHTSKKVRLDCDECPTHLKVFHYIMHDGDDYDEDDEDHDDDDNDNNGDGDGDEANNHAGDADGDADETGDNTDNDEQKQKKRKRNRKRQRMVPLHGFIPPHKVAEHLEVKAALKTLVPNHVVTSTAQQVKANEKPLEQVYIDFVKKSLALKLEKEKQLLQQSKEIHATLLPAAEAIAAPKRRQRPKPASFSHTEENNPHYVIRYCQDIHRYMRFEMSLAEQCMASGTTERLRFVLLEQLVVEADGVLIQDEFDGFIYHLRQYRVPYLKLIYDLLIMAGLHAPVIEDMTGMIREEVADILRLTATPPKQNPVLFVNGIHSIMKKFLTLVKVAFKSDPLLVNAVRTAVEYPLCSHPHTTQLLAQYIHQLSQSAYVTITTWLQSLDKECAEHHEKERKKSMITAAALRAARAIHANITEKAKPKQSSKQQQQQQRPPACDVPAPEHERSVVVDDLPEHPLMSPGMETPPIMGPTGAIDRRPYAGHPQVLSTMAVLGRHQLRKFYPPRIGGAFGLSNGPSPPSLPSHHNLARIYGEFEENVKKWLSLVDILHDKDKYEEYHRTLLADRLIGNVHLNYGYSASARPNYVSSVLLNSGFDQSSPSFHSYLMIHKDIPIYLLIDAYLIISLSNTIPTAAMEHMLRDFCSSAAVNRRLVVGAFRENVISHLTFNISIIHKIPYKGRQPSKRICEEEEERDYQERLRFLKQLDEMLVMYPVPAFRFSPLPKAVCDEYFAYKRALQSGAAGTRISVDEGSGGKKRPRQDSTTSSSSSSAATSKSTSTTLANPALSAVTTTTTTTTTTSMSPPQALPAGQPHAHVTSPYISIADVPDTCIPMVYPTVLTQGTWSCDKLDVNAAVSIINTTVPSKSATRPVILREPTRQVFNHLRSVDFGLQFQNPSYVLDSRGKYKVVPPRPSGVLPPSLQYNTTALTAAAVEEAEPVSPKIGLIPHPRAYSLGTTISVPMEVQALLEVYRSEYTEQWFKGRRLLYNFDLTTCIVTIQFYPYKMKPKEYSSTVIRTYEFITTFYQFIVMNLFNNQYTFTFQEILELTGIPTATLQAELLCLAHPRTGLLLKHPNNITFDATHTFTLNHLFSSKIYRIRIPRLNAESAQMASDAAAAAAAAAAALAASNAAQSATDAAKTTAQAPPVSHRRGGKPTLSGTVTAGGANGGTNNTTKSDPASGSNSSQPRPQHTSETIILRRETAIDGQIVRLLKTHRQMPHKELVRRVKEGVQPWFIADDASIKARIEAQIDIFNIERDDVDRKLYRYC